MAKKRKVQAKIMRARGQLERHKYKRFKAQAKRAYKKKHR